MFSIQNEKAVTDEDLLMETTLNGEEEVVEETVVMDEEALLNNEETIETSTAMDHMNVIERSVL